MKYSLTAKGHGKDAWVRWILSPTTTVAASTASACHRYCRVLRQSHGARTEQYLRAAEVEKELQRKAQHNENNKKPCDVEELPYCRIAGGRYWSEVMTQALKVLDAVRNRFAMASPPAITM